MTNIIHVNDIYLNQYLPHRMTKIIPVNGIDLNQGLLWMMVMLVNGIYLLQ